MLRYRVISLLSLLILVGLFLMSQFYEPLSYWVFIGVGILWLLITALGSFNIQWNYHLKSLCSQPLAPHNLIAITFDDGPDPQYTPQILALLKAHGAKATFFCIGKQVEQYPKLAAQIIQEGHTIGNHTYSHSNYFGFFSSPKVQQELKKTQDIIQEVINRKSLLYRPAFGVTNPAIAKAVRALKLHSIGWSIRSLDTTSRSTNKILANITKTLGPGDIVLLHDTSSKSVVILEHLLLFLQQKQLTAVPVDQLLQIDAYA